MNDGYLWWLILVGAVVMLAVIAVFSARLPRSERDVGDGERLAEAAWISDTIERFGGVAPTDLVEEVLELHAEYLASPRLARVPDASQAQTAIGSQDPLGPAPVLPPTGPGGSAATVPPATLAPRTVTRPPLPPQGPPPPPLGRADRTPPRPR